MSKPKVPAVSNEGQIMVSAGRYARTAVLTAFEQMGGVKALTKWGKKNKTDFYTKVFPKVIGRETEDRAPEGSVEDLLEAIDIEAEEVAEDAVDAEFEDV